MDRYAVVGNPVAHSLSPRIHAAFARATGDAIEYERLHAPLDAFDPTVRAFFAAGGRGLNVTLPFKMEAFALADERSERASLAGAANFLALRGDRIAADNTDGAGLVADLRDNLGVSLEGRTVLMLGAGGAARGVVAPLLAERPARLVIANRTAERARSLASRFAPHGRVEALDVADLGRLRCDVVVNATSATTKGEALPIPPEALAAHVTAYDMAYGAAARPFLELARSRGARAADGLGMLVEQAAESFFLWRGKRPRTRELIAELRAELA